MKKIVSIALICFFIVFSADAKTKKVGLVLSGGGALGFAHIGAIQALEENGIHPNVIAGSSMGAIVGVLYAEGLTPMEMLQIIKDEKLYKKTTLLKVIPSLDSKLGIYSHVATRNLLSRLLPHNSFDSLPKDFYACVTNLDDATWEIASKGNQLKEYVIASAAIPGVFEAEIINGKTYIDGGTLNNLPAQAIRSKCDVLIGVDVLPVTYQKANKTADVLFQALRATQHQNSLEGRKMCDYLIESYAINRFNEFDFEEYLEIYKYGYSAMKTYISKHPEMLKQCK